MNIEISRTKAQRADCLGHEFVTALPPAPIDPPSPHPIPAGQLESNLKKKKSWRVERSSRRPQHSRSWPGGGRARRASPQASSPTHPLQGRSMHGGQRLSSSSCRPVHAAWMGIKLALTHLIACKISCLALLAASNSFWKNRAAK
jgi:hypothetical protein